MYSPDLAFVKRMVVYKEPLDRRLTSTFSNALSYMFSRATKAVRLVSPAYYADVACERGRCYVRKLLHGYVGDGNTNVSGSGAEDVMKEAQQLLHGGVHKALKETMFYL